MLEPAAELAKQAQQRVAELRDEILAHVKSRQGAYDVAAARARLAQLDLRDFPGDDPAAMELGILLALCDGKPAKRIRKPLWRLSRVRLGAGQSAAFREFQELVLTFEERGNSFEGFMPVVYFDLVDHAPIWADAAAALDAVTRVAGPCFINSGTLLGAVREGALIAHDDDLDLCLMLEAGTMEEAADAWIAAYHALRAAKLVPKPPKRNHGVFKLRGTSGINIDLFPGWIAEGRAYIYPHTFGTVPAGAVLPLASCAKTGLPIPADAEAVLASNYGESWRVPDAGYVFNWGGANRRFERFREALVADMSRWD
jgi:LicD family